MKKSSYLLGMLALGLLSISATSGCSSEDPANSGPNGGMAAGGMAAGGMATGGVTAGGGSGGAPASGVPKMTGQYVAGAAAFTILSATDAVAGPAPAPEGYTKMGCNGCHGTHGQGAASLGPEIRHTPATYSNYVVRNGRPSSFMSPFPEASLTTAQLAEIQTWLAGQPKPTTGQGLYLDYCANCHGPTGGGGSVPVKASALPTATITATVRAGAGADPAQRGLYMPAFGADILTDAEVTMIAQFLGGT